jgi:hypothetical protein
MADRKILFRSGANVNEASPSADRARVMGVLSDAATVSLENSGGQTATLGATALTVTVDVAVNGGDLTTTAGTGTLFNTTATTVNVGGAATTVSIGAGTGTTTINNANTVVTGDLAVNGGDLTSTATTFSALNAVVTTLNLGGAATTLSIGSVTGTATINNATTAIAGVLAANGGSMTTDDTTFNLLNTTATTINFGGAATAVEIGATTGTTSVNNSLAVDGDVTLGNASADTVTQNARWGSDFLFTDADRTIGWNSASARTLTFDNAGAGTLAAIVPGTTNETDLGLTATRWKQGWFQGDVTTAGNFVSGGTITVNGTTNTISATGAMTLSTSAGGITIDSAGTTTLSDPVTMSDDLAVNGGDITSTATTFNLLNATVTTMNLGGAATTLNAGAAGSTFATGFNAVTSSQGTVALFNTTTTTLNVGGAATTMNVGNSAGTVTFPGDIALNGGDLTTTATTFNLLNATATTVNFAQAGTSIIMGALTGETRIRNNARVTGNLIVEGTTTTVNSEEVLLDDNHLFLNHSYATASAETGGLVVNYLPIATSTTVATGGFTAGVASTSNPTVITVGSGTFAVGQFIMIYGAANNNNNGLFEVLTHTGTTLTIRGVGVTATVEDFTQNQFTTDTTVAGSITRVTVSTIRSGTDGLWEQGAGATTPVTFTDFSTSTASGWTDDGAVVRLTTVGDIVGIGTATDLGAKLQVVGDTVGDITVLIREVASQTANALQIQDSAGTMISSFNAAGDLIFGNTDHTVGYNSASARILTFDNAGAGTLASIRPGTTGETDLGVTGTRFKDGWFSGDVSATGNLVSGATITVNGTTNTITYSAAGSIVTSAGALTLTGAAGVTTASNFSTSGTGTFSFGSSGAVTAAGNPTFNFGTSLSTFGGATSTSGTATFNGNVATAGTGTFSFGSSGAVTAAGNPTFNFGTSLSTFGGAATVTGTLSANGNVALGDAAADTIAFNGVLTTNIVPDVNDAVDLGSLTGPKRFRSGFYGTSINIGATGTTWNQNTGNIAGTWTGTHTTAATNVAGSFFFHTAGTGGIAGGGVAAGAGGQLSVRSGVGGAAAPGAGNTAGTGGSLSLLAFAGGAGADTNAGGAGGVVSLLAGTGGAGSATGVAGAGGQISITAGSAGTDGGGGGGNGSNVTITPGSASGAGINGSVFINVLNNTVEALTILDVGANRMIALTTTTGAQTIDFGSTGTNPTTIFRGTGAVRPNTNTVAGSSFGASSFGWGAVFMRNVADTATVNLRSSTAAADGALAIGYDPTGNITITATNVSDALGQLDAALVGSGNVTFTAAAGIDSGTVVYVSSNDNCTMAIGTAESTSRVFGVAEAAITAAATGVITTTFGGLIENFRLVNGLTPTANGEIFLSDATAGRGTTTAPTTSGSVIKKLGIIKDASAYVTVTNPFVEAIFQPEPGTLIA